MKMESKNNREARPKLGSNDQHMEQQDFIFETFLKFMQLCGNGNQATLNLECRDGGVLVNFNVFLGRQENIYSVPSSNSTVRNVPSAPRKSRSSPSKLRRNWARSKAHHERK